MNRICITGRLTKAPEKRMAGEIPCTSFSVAVDRPYTKDKTDYFSCVAWRATADFVARYFGKGDMIGIDGYLTIREWEKDGVKHKTPEIVCDNISFGGNKQSTQKSEQKKPTDDYGIMDDPDEELPF